MVLKRNDGVKGYGRRDPGRYSLGRGLELHISPLGKSVWKARIRDGEKNTVKKLGDAHSLQNQYWALARLNELKAGVVVAENSIGAALIDWTESKLLTKRWSDRHHKKTVERLKNTWSTFGIIRLRSCLVR